MECIILAGGLGTRLQNVIGDIPKCMAPVNNKPFLAYLFNYLATQNCKKIILSLGYKYESILEWLQTQNTVFKIEYVIEKEPLGTGGGIQLALNKTVTDNICVLNGDTYFGIPLNELLHFHITCNAETTLALKQMVDFDRYGVVKMNNFNIIQSFEEKQYKESGLINGGIYIINKNEFLKKNLPEKFSFEKDYLEKYVHENRFHGYVSNSYFIDIGVPTDYNKAQIDFKNNSL